jgi:hypothetical protein
MWAIRAEWDIAASKSIDVVLSTEAVGAVLSTRYSRFSSVGIGC